jgi:hypothetical protein
LAAADHLAPLISASKYRDLGEFFPIAAHLSGNTKDFEFWKGELMKLASMTHSSKYKLHFIETQADRSSS